MLYFARNIKLLSILLVGIYGIILFNHIINMLRKETNIYGEKNIGRTNLKELLKIGCVYKENRNVKNIVDTLLLVCVFDEMSL